MKEQILALLAQGQTYNEIVSKLGCSKSTVSFHARRAGYGASPKVVDWNEVQAFYDLGHTVVECAEKFDFAPSSWYDAKSQGKVTSRPVVGPKALAIDDKRRNGKLLKNAMRRAGVEEKCAECGLGPSWNGKPITLEVDHINGINTDNRLENLRFLCPNCHSQTDTANGKNVVRLRSLVA